MFQAMITQSPPRPLLKKGFLLNLMVGESHVSFAFDPSLQFDVHGGSKVITDAEGGWKGFCYYGGATIFSVPDKLVNDLEYAGISLGNYRGKDIVFNFGTNDSLFFKRDRAMPDDYVYKYIEFIEGVRSKYGFRNAYVTTPWYIRHDVYEYKHMNQFWADAEREGRFSEPLVRDQVIAKIDEAIIKETSNYQNIHAVSMLNLFNEDGELFNKKYTLDGVHFNETGRKLFFDVITREMKQQEK